MIKQIYIGKYLFEIDNFDNDYDISIIPKKQEGCVSYFTVKADFKKEIIPETFRVSVQLASNGAFSCWNVGKGFRRDLGTFWDRDPLMSSAAAWAPLHAIVNARCENVVTCCIADFKTPISIGSGIVEENPMVWIVMDFFSECAYKTQSYETVLRLDTEKKRYERAVSEAVKLWFDDAQLKLPNVPDTARLPMYSTWYSFHQVFDHVQILQQCKLSKIVGCDTVIVDDGWQTVDGSKGYMYCGDWQCERSKMGNMRQFTDGIHKLGLKVMLWFAVPFIGKKSAACKRFQGKFLDDGAKGWYTLDVRYPEVREYLIHIYLDAVQNWKLDGLKLDFIDNMHMYEQTPAYKDGMDTVAIGDAIHKLLQDIMDSLKQINPDIMIEFRQTYIGPLMQTYGNMLRVADCCADARTNRFGIINMRLITSKTAIHSDMITWDMNESVESAAAQITNILFGVPQISVKIDKLPAPHMKMLKFYMNFWIKNREVLLDGDLAADNPEAGYTLVTSRKDDEVIAVNYANAVLNADYGFQKLTYVNAGSGDTLYIDFGSHSLKAQVRIINCMGEPIADEKMRLSGAVSFEVPQSGMTIIQIIK